MLAESRQRNPRPQTARVFFALWPSAEIARRLASVAGEYAKSAGGRVTRGETIHLTLAFLGDVAVERMPEMQQAAGTVRTEAFDLTLDHFGVWHHNRLFWAGCTAMLPALAELSSSLNHALQAAGFVVADAKRHFTPHITLVRKVVAFDAALPACQPLSWRCDKFVLVRSQLSAAGSAYQTLAEFPLFGDF